MALIRFGFFERCFFEMLRMNVPLNNSAFLFSPKIAFFLLYFGQISATEAARMGRLDVNDPNSLPVWDRVMSTSYKPACADGF